MRAGVWGRARAPMAEARLARISEIHYSNAYAAQSGVAEFVEIALSPAADPSDFTLGFYSATGAQGLAVQLDDPNVQVRYDEAADELVYTVSSEHFPFVVTDPDGGQGNYPAVALGSDDGVAGFYDWGGGTREIHARDGIAEGATSENIPVPTSPNDATYSIQFNQPNPDAPQYLPVTKGESGVICFAAGTRILMLDGERPVETLRPGDLVQTRDSGLRPVAWIGRRRVCGLGALAPVEIPPGAFGAKRALRVSPQHRMLVRGAELQVATAETEAFVAAKHLCGGGAARARPVPLVTYVHVMFDRHEAIWAEGAPTESFYAGPCSLDAMSGAMRAEFDALFPALTAGDGPAGGLARPDLSRWEAIAAGFG